MTERIRQRPLIWCSGTIAVLAIGAAVGAPFLPKGSTPASSHGQEPVLQSTESAATTGVSVAVIHPRPGLLARTTVQPGSLQAYESVQLYAKVSGYLVQQTVDIGDRVKKGQVLAVVDVPELEKQAQKNAAALDQAMARVDQVKAQKTSALAGLAAAKAAVEQAEAGAKSAAAWVRFRHRQHQRMQELYTSRSIEERLVDESKEKYEASVETELSAKANISTAKAQVAAADAKVQLAEADLTEALAAVKVFRADLERTQVQVAFATVRAPFDGVVVHRSFFPGDFIRSAAEGGIGQPLLTVQRTDRMRVVVQVPDSVVPYTDAGDPATVEIDALPGTKVEAKVSRVAASEDPQTRLMRVEIDLPNTDGKLRQGMYGRVRIRLDKGDGLSIPSSCLVGNAGGGEGTVYVVRDGRARRTAVKLDGDNGLRVGVRGLTAEDAVILQPIGSLADGAPVRATVAKES